MPFLSLFLELEPEPLLELVLYQRHEMQSITHFGPTPAPKRLSLIHSIPQGKRITSHLPPHRTSHF
jgi:hypothetical protein